MEMLHHIFNKQCDLEARMDKIEENMIQKPDMLTHHKAVRKTKVLNKKVHQIICKISGETGEDLHNELNDILPMMSIDAVFDMEEKLHDTTYQDAVVSILLSVYYIK
ncbi:PREDICTED: uncharacterized protein LOC108377822 [Rhagoletis zephyria]|uniref:uncharacterized protein LOC108377822 n=1 Tax=Rhagoletis zephyria TaxID=28612 RepID=UPI0008116611|nr:PREDICTED: uncharacterized protein LOC108377822 [Rhagoletis zephyria]